ncbi:hypothetical protein Q4S57_12285 [Priestia megaterium]|uniref:hypothetical protein n=1 Tax=Priestia megaterium TaxID=1404 RepID=UPI0026E1FF25|nr:hypothetical protein [Priestia megaterium]MDO6848731.1 hypothetical protein [Priestia megaterium]
MKLVKKIKSILLIDDKVEKEKNIEDIGDILEYGCLDNLEIKEGINLLLLYLPLEKDHVLKESILHTIHNGIVYHDGASEISLDLLLQHLPTFNEEHLTYVLTFLGFSGTQKYVITLELYLNHCSEEIKERAKEAISEIKHRDSKAEK